MPSLAGLEIIFVRDGVLVGDTYFALITTGILKVTGVRMLAESPPSIVFRTVTTWANRFGSRALFGALRIPVSLAGSAAAARVLAHYQRVDAREVIVNHGFYRGRMGVGLIGAPIFFAVATAGLVLKFNGIYNDNDDVSGLPIGIGILLGGGMLVLALAAWSMSRAQLHKPPTR